MPKLSRITMGSGGDSAGAGVGAGADGAVWQPARAPHRQKMRTILSNCEPMRASLPFVFAVSGMSPAPKADSLVRSSIAAMPADDSSSSVLQLGVRELFRIFVPGAYAALLLSVLPGLPLVLAKTISSTSSQIAVAFFLGLVAYALRPHECWWPYNRVFWKHVNELETEIELIVGKAPTADGHTATYKYLLTTGSAVVRERVHYFSSFYYMLIALSLFSAFAAMSLFFIPALLLSREFKSGGFWITLSLLGLASVVQYLRMQRVEPTKGRPSKLEIGFVLAILGAILVQAADFALHSGVLHFSLSRMLWMGACAALAVVFASLGNKQWKSIVNEQKVHVRSAKDSLLKLVNT